MFVTSGNTGSLVRFVRGGYGLFFVFCVLLQVQTIAKAMWDSMRRIRGKHGSWAHTVSCGYILKIRVRGMADLILLSYLIGREDPQEVWFLLGILKKIFQPA
jgi:hypothetical protein